MIDFFIEEKPVPKGRPQFRKTPNGLFPYTPPKTARWEKLVAELAESSAPPAPFDGPVEVRLDFYLLCPVSWSVKKRRTHHGAHHSGHPDIDNLTKAVCDGLNPDPKNPRPALFLDDQQIAMLIVTKRWDMMREGVRIRVRPFEPNP